MGNRVGGALCARMGSGARGAASVALAAAVSVGWCVGAGTAKAESVRCISLSVEGDTVRLRGEALGEGLAGYLERCGLQEGRDVSVEPDAEGYVVRSLAHREEEGAAGDGAASEEGADGGDDGASEGAGDEPRGGILPGM